MIKPKNNGNGKHHKKNGKAKRKTGQKAGITDKLIETEAIKHDGSPSKIAKALGIQPQTAHVHLQKPHIKKAVMDAREKALKAAGITRARVYKTVAEGLDATKTISAMLIAQDGEGMKDANSMEKDFIEVTDFKERRETAKLCLQLFGDLKDVPANAQNIFHVYFPGKSKMMDVIDVEYLEATE